MQYNIQRRPYNNATSICQLLLYTDHLTFIVRVCYNGYNKASFLFKKEVEVLHGIY